MSGNANKDLYSTFVTSGPWLVHRQPRRTAAAPEPAPLLPTQAPLAGPVVPVAKAASSSRCARSAAADGYDLISNNTGGRGADKLGAAVFDATGITRAGPAVGPVRVLHAADALHRQFGALRRVGHAPRAVPQARRADRPARPSKAFTAAGQGGPGRCHRTARLRAPPRPDWPERRRVDAAVPPCRASRPTPTPR